MEKITLVANPGSASRKYALFIGNKRQAHIHFEYANGHIDCTVTKADHSQTYQSGLTRIDAAAGQVLPLLTKHHVLTSEQTIDAIGLRVVAPSGFFLQDHLMSDEVAAKLQAVAERAPLHIHATLLELAMLNQYAPDIPIYGISDSAFHATKPDYAWNYGLPLDDADRLDIKRFGYHGISVASIVSQLRNANKLPHKLVVCHLGSGASVSGVYRGRSIDTTMGYSPLEGLIMATRTGSIDPTATKVIQNELQLDNHQLEEYLTTKSGLLGLSGSSSDIRSLLGNESAGDHRAELALQTYVYSVQKAIGQMSAAIGGIDMLVFTGTVGERSAVIRERILQPFHYLDLTIDRATNAECTNPAARQCISLLAKSKPIYVIPTDETAEIARRTQALLAQA